jgi:hypothetical protein
VYTGTTEELKDVVQNLKTDAKQINFDDNLGFKKY